MGIHNVKAVFAIWYGLPDVPFRLLTYMAARSMDDDDPPVYFGGWEELALAGGRMVPDRSDTSTQATKERRARLVSVTSAMKRLVESGAVKVVSRGAPGRNAMYSLNLDTTTVQAHPALNTASQSCTVEDGNRSNSAGSTGNSAGPACITVQDQPAPEEQSKEQEKEQAAGTSKLAAAARMIQKHKPMLTESAAVATAQAITEAKKPRNPAGLIKHLAEAGELDQWIVMPPAPPPAGSVTHEQAKRHPPCQHGQPGGNLLNPNGGKPWCPACRTQARQKDEDASW